MEQLKAKVVLIDPSRSNPTINRDFNLLVKVKVVFLFQVKSDRMDSN